MLSVDGEEGRTRGPVWTLSIAPFRFDSNVGTKDVPGDDPRSADAKAKGVAARQRVAARDTLLGPCPLREQPARCNPDLVQSMFMPSEGGPAAAWSSVCPPSEELVPTTKLKARSRPWDDPVVDAVLTGGGRWHKESGVTTLVVRNIPKRYTLEALLGQWKPDGSYDLMYYPYNMRWKRRIGLCFINFVSHELALEFQGNWHKQAFSDQDLPFDIVSATQQGLMANLDNFRGKRLDLMTNAEFLPALFQGTQRIDSKATLVSLGIL